MSKNTYDVTIRSVHVYNLRVTAADPIEAQKVADQMLYDHPNMEPDSTYDESDEAELVECVAS